MGRENKHEEWQNPSGMAYHIQNMDQREALEAEFEKTTMSALAARPSAGTLEKRGRPVVQIMTCIGELRLGGRSLQTQLVMIGVTPCLGKCKTLPPAA